MDGPSSFPTKPNCSPTVVFEVKGLVVTHPSPAPIARERNWPVARNAPSSPNGRAPERAAKVLDRQQAKSQANRAALIRRVRKAALDRGEHKQPLLTIWR